MVACLDPQNCRASKPRGMKMQKSPMQSPGHTMQAALRAHCPKASRSACVKQTVMCLLISLWLIPACLPSGMLVAAGPPGAWASALCRLRAAAASAGSAICGRVWLVMLSKDPAQTKQAKCSQQQGDIGLICNEAWINAACLAGLVAAIDLLTVQHAHPLVGYPVPRRLCSRLQGAMHLQAEVSGVADTSQILPCSLVGSITENLVLGCCIIERSSKSSVSTSCSMALRLLCLGR